MSKTLEQSFFETLNEKQKRLFAGLRANERGWYGVQEVSEQLGIHPHTIRAGQKELVEMSETNKNFPRIRKVGGGRKKTLKESRK